MITDTEFAEKLLALGRRPCPRCGRMMPATLEICVDCQWDEALTAAHQEAIDEAQWMAEMEAREADWREWQQERGEMAQCGGF